MTIINVNVTNSGGTAFNGKCRVKLARVLSGDTTLALPLAVDYPITAGNASFNLAPSQAANVPYQFDILETISVPADTSTTPTTPAYTYDLVYSTFNSVVPDSLTPITFNNLVASSGIFQDNTDASFVALAQRLYFSNGFWDTLQSTLFKPKGVYLASTFYRRGDMVFLDGATYLNLSSVQQQGILPSPNPPFVTWFPLGTKGTVGTGTTGNDTVYDATVWDNQIDAPSRNSVRDVIETLATKATLASGYVTRVAGVLDTPTLVADPPPADSTLKVPTTSWVQGLLNVIRNALTPIGAIVAYAGSSAPSKWILCDGRTLLRSQYPELFALVSTMYNTGGELATEFRVPDLRGRVPAGLDQMSPVSGNANRLQAGWATTVGGAGGNGQVVLGVNEMPSHGHTPTSGATFLGQVASGGTIAFSAGTQGLNTASTANTGGGQPHNNIQPTMTLAYIIYTGV
jgi:microcystin-dependent protein